MDAKTLSQGIYIATVANHGPGSSGLQLVQCVKYEWEAETDPVSTYIFGMDYQCSVTKILGGPWTVEEILERMSKA